MNNKKLELMSPVRKNEKYGFFELTDKYRKQMRLFYQDEYYQEERAVYKNRIYDSIDIEHKNFFFNQKLYVSEKWGALKSHSFLDIGTGEGYALSFFDEKGWEVTGIDFSSYGIEIHNPNMLPKLLTGDFSDIISDLSISGKKFDIINADNLLEHLPDPERFFENIRGVAHDGTIICVTVPNDYSRMQYLAYEMGKIDTPFWVTTETSEHFNYFSAESLTALGQGSGFEKIIALGDWPIDFFLLHNKTNYRNDSSTGHDCHVACTQLENSIYKESMEKAVKLFQALADVGIGRDISVYFRMTA